MSHNPNTDEIVSKMISKNEDIVDRCIKSQSDLNPCNEGKRKSDVLLSTIEELERTKKQLEIAEMALKEIEKDGTNPEIKTITVLCVNNFLRAHKALKEIEELNK